MLSSEKAFDKAKPSTKKIAFKPHRNECRFYPDRFQIYRTYLELPLSLRNYYRIELGNLMNLLCNQHSISTGGRYDANLHHRNPIETEQGNGRQRFRPEPCGDHRTAEAARQHHRDY